MPDLDPQFLGTPYTGSVLEHAVVVSVTGFYFYIHLRENVEILVLPLMDLVPYLLSFTFVRVIQCYK